MDYSNTLIFQETIEYISTVQRPSLLWEYITSFWWWKRRALFAKIWSHLAGNRKQLRRVDLWRNRPKIYGDSVATVIKVIPQVVGTAIKSLVNIYTYEDMHFEEQAIRLKKLFYKYKAKRIVIDANGIGAGLVDYMVKP